MHPAIGFVMVGLLENLVGADARRLDRGVAGMVQGSGVDVDAADFALAGRGGVNLPHALGHELGRVARMLAEDQNQPLVPLVLQGQHLPPEFVCVQRAANLPAVRAAERAIKAVVRAIVAHVQRRKQHDPIAVNLALQPPGGVEHLLHQARLVGRQQQRRSRPPKGVLSTSSWRQSPSPRRRRTGRPTGPASAPRR